MQMFLLIKLQLYKREQRHFELRVESKHSIEGWEALYSHLFHS